MGAENISIGPCRVYFDGEDLGLTKGGVTLELDTDTYDVVVDQFGDTPVFSNISARTVKVTVPMVETTAENMVLAMPAAVLETDAADPTKKIVKIFSGIGTDLRDLAKPLLLHPTSETGQAKDVIIPLAVSPGSLSFAYESNNERIFNGEYMGFINTDTASPDLGLLMTFGDPTTAP